jgi:tRNA (cytidine/uridine-2'-O-)-methyltransferase
MKVILFQPQIPQNAGNVVRTCAVTGSSLILVRPLFSTSNRWLKRAGLDYWENVFVEVIDDLMAYLETTSNPFFFYSSKAKTPHSEVSYSPEHLLIFGSETEGLPLEFHKKWPDRFLTIPMIPNARCLNLATSVGIVVYEAWRHLNYRI